MICAKNTAWDLEVECPKKVHLVLDVSSSLASNVLLDDSSVMLSLLMPQPLKGSFYTAQLRGLFRAGLEDRQLGLPLGKC